MFKFSFCPYSQELEIPTYFWGNVCWYPALSSSPQLGIPSTNMDSQDSIQRQLREFIQLKSLPHNSQLFFPLLFCLIELVWGQIFFHKQVQFKFWQPHEYCFKQLWKSVLGLLICCIFEAADNFRGGITSEGDCHCQETLNLPLFHYQLPYNEISLKWHENYIKSIITS